MHDEELQQHHHRDVMHHAVAERGRPEPGDEARAGEPEVGHGGQPAASHRRQSERPVGRLAAHAALKRDRAPATSAR